MRPQRMRLHCLALAPQYAVQARSIGPAAGFFSGWAILLDYLLIPTPAYVAVAKRSPLICVKPTVGRSRSIFFRDRKP
jgi:hypothetical protein